MLLVSHLPILETRNLTWPDEAACAVFAQRLAAVPRLRNPTFIALDGPLGAGKTTFVRHLLRALGVAGRIKSPTYAVLEPYEVDGLVISHFDFYRFDSAREWADAGFRDIFAAPGLKIAEWPQKAASALPPADWWMELEPDNDTQRSVTLHALTEHGQQLLADIA